MGKKVIETSSSWEMNGVFLKLSVLQFLSTLYVLHILKHLALQVYSFVH